MQSFQDVSDNGAALLRLIDQQSPLD